MTIQRDRVRGTYQIIFAPWISEKTIRWAYRTLQSGDNRPLGTKSLSTFHFVHEHTAVGETLKWTELTRLWNEQHPDPEDKFWDKSAFRKAYERARERLVSL